ncbi:MFS Git1p-related glycerophosphoinositol and glycerophosphocholine permease [Rhizoctonia solani AG-3 Rhs1AP]|uniref:MFS Git1p-related glycerophosphoinositol and glycerophosphocholine permease n=2 Tax=Rhizoctonia solani AG-3 TaxID=1086053 RepID=A0A074RXM1_9AGAM|nr:MFS Git1p-related glycerophosphoinositol and glycerophosphocholine permease [Rhizoctonia solani AG-3 Rhs1AP]KEP51684.1 MFS Git1p-related glycerophosphoinositol and glycerophosphocholine permease [Rhizoctonia solani 123E]
MADPTSTPKKLGLSQVSLIFACGTALFSDGYANGVIGNVNTILRRLYPDTIARHDYGTTLASLAFAGTIVGMLSFGYLSDRLGRKFGMMSATLIVAVFSFLSACSAGAHGSTDGLLAMLCACRFLLGIGVGAEYPSGSVAASEQSEEEGIAKNAQHRWFALATNTMIDTGFVISAFTPLVLLWIFGENHLRAVWRGSLGLGVIPALAVLVWRLRMSEPTRYKRDSMKNAKTPYMLILRRYWKSLAAISITWFIYDFITYPFGIYSSTVVDSIIGDTKSLYVIFGWNVVINLFYIPGTVTGAFVVDYLGPKYTMIIGLLCQAVIGFGMSGGYQYLKNHIAGFAILYGIFLSFGELGPGNCLGLLASKSGPTAVRGQFYGIAAAIGKVGAFVGTWAFPPIIEAFGGASSTRGNTGPFWIGSGLAILSALITLAFIRPLSHDGMIDEDIKFREYLAKHGYDTSKMGLASTSDVDSVEAQNLGEVEKEKASL